MNSQIKAHTINALTITAHCIKDASTDIMNIANHILHYITIDGSHYVTTDGMYYQCKEK